MGWDWTRFEKYARLVHRLNFVNVNVAAEYHLLSNDTTELRHESEYDSSSSDTSSHSGYSSDLEYVIDYHSSKKWNPILDVIARYIAIASHGRTSPKILFPQLRVLRWVAFTGDASSDYSVLFMHESVRTFAFFCNPRTLYDYHIPPTRRSISLYFDLVWTRMPSLTSLELDIDPSLLPPALIVDILIHLPYLETVVLPTLQDLESMEHCLEGLAAMSHLQELVFRGGHIPLGQQAISEGNMPSISGTHDIPHPFPCLRRLEMEGLDYRAALRRIISHSSLSTLRLHSQRAEHPTRLASVFSALAISSPNSISEVSLAYVEAGPSDHMDGQLHDYIIRFSHVEPLLLAPGSHKLQKLTLVGVKPVDFSVDELDRLARALPRLTSLILNHFPDSKPPSGPALPLKVLISFAQYCAGLTELALFMHAGESGIPEGEELYKRFQSLRNLRVGLSIISKEDLIPASIFLSKLLPIGCEVSAEPLRPVDRTIRMSWYQGRYHYARKWAKLWSRLNNALPPLVTRDLQISDRKG